MHAVCIWACVCLYMYSLGPIGNDVSHVSSAIYSYIATHWMFVGSLLIHPVHPKK